MRKMKLFTTLLTSAFALCALSSCTSQEEAQIKSYIPAPEVIQREGVNIKSITFENVPSQIKIGYFDHYGIYLKIVYSDDAVENYPLTMSSFPEALKSVFNTVGTHQVTIAFRGEELSYTFNVVQGKAFYLIRYFSYDGHVLAQEKVIPGDKPTINPPEAPVVTDPMYKYTFTGWDKTVDKTTQATEDVDVHSLYQKTQKRYHSSKTLIPNYGVEHLRVLHTGATPLYGQYQVTFYLGRIDRVPLVYSDYYSTETPHIEGDLYFDSSAKSEATQNIVDRIYDKSLNVNTDDYDDYFETTLGTEDPVTKPKYIGTYSDIDTMTNNNSYAIFEGDTSFTELYKNDIYSFVNDHDIDHKIHYSMNAASDLITGNPYYRAAVETSVDVVVRSTFNNLEISKGGDYQISGYKYYFLFNSSNTYSVAEYCGDTNFNSTGTQLTYSMEELSNLFSAVEEAYNE